VAARPSECRLRTSRSAIPPCPVFCCYRCANEIPVPWRLR
jgi:hypothetical protein